MKVGTCECFVKDVGLVKTVATGDYFGERALIKAEPRAADVQAKGSATVLALDRDDFVNLLGELGPVLEENMLKDALRGAPLLKGLNAAERESILDCFAHADFKEGQLIFRQGDPGYSFVLIREGTVKCIKDGEEVAELHQGDYVGERSLLFGDCRACDVLVTSPDCQIAYLVKDAFEKVMGPVTDVLRRTARDKIKRDELQELRILGTGTFGKVKLVKHTPSGNTYAMKIIAKQKVVAYNQQEHVMNEKRLMEEIDHPFCVSCVATFKDQDHLYMVLEFLAGGELFSLLARERRLKEDAASFYAAQVMLAFSYLHNLNIIYRDLKPENLLIDNKGFMKIVDFGFAKRIKDRTWTLCGTPEYLAPETIRNKGHGKGVDWWALGVLIYEMMAGYPPFCGDSPMATYKLILEGALDFPQMMALQARDIVRRLLHPAYSKRLGCLRNGSNDVYTHRYFEKINMSDLTKHRVTPPFVPTIKDNLDTSNFQHYEDVADEPYKDDGSNWEEDF